MSGNTDDVDDEITRYFIMMQKNEIKKEHYWRKKTLNITIKWKYLTKIHSFFLFPSPHQASHLPLLFQGRTTPTSPPPCRQICKSLRAYIFLDPESKLGKSKEQIIQEWKYKFRKLLKAFFCYQQNKQYKIRRPASKFLHPPIQVRNSYLKPLFENKRLLHSVSLFSKEYLNTYVRTNKMVN